MVNPPLRWRVKRYSHGVRIGELSQRTEVPIRTIRYYERIGVLPDPERTPAGYRDYGSETVDRLRFVRSSQAVGFSLGEIREILAFRDQGETPCAHVVAALRRRRDEYVERIAALEEARAVIDGLVERAGRLRAQDCSADLVCHVIPPAVVRRAPAPRRARPASAE